MSLGGCSGEDRVTEFVGIDVCDSVDPVRIACRIVCPPVGFKQVIDAGVDSLISCTDRIVFVKYRIPARGFVHKDIDTRDRVLSPVSVAGRCLGSRCNAQYAWRKDQRIIRDLALLLLPGVQRINAGWGQRGEYQHGQQDGSQAVHHIVTSEVLS